MEITITRVVVFFTLSLCLVVLLRSLWLDIKTIGPMEKQIDELFRNEKIYHAEIESLKVKVYFEVEKRLALERKITSMEEEVVKRGEKICELEGHVDKLKQQIIELNASVALKESRIAELEAERNSRTGTGPL